MQVIREPAVKQRARNGTSAQNKHLGGMRILCSQTEWSRVLVVDLVDMFIERSGMECLMGEIMEHILEEEEEC